MVSMEKALQLNGGDAVNWFYRGEGAANMVLAYQGTDPLLVGKVLRVKKSASDPNHVQKASMATEPGNPILMDEEQRLWAKWPSVVAATSMESLMQAYARDIISPLLGHELVDPGVLINVSSEFLKTVAHNVHHVRPLWRLIASQIDISSNTARLISDHSMFLSSADTEQGSLSSISVEIKPKCGFLPTSSFIAPENSVKKEVPRFTMHQFLKLLEGQVKRISGYSPLDLFSGSLERISRAICALFDNPQNNLRVFVGGTVIDTGASACSQDASFGTTWQGLCEVLKGCLCCEVEEDAIDVLKELVAQSLYETEALSNLLAAQKLDAYDIEGAIHAYNRLRVGTSDEHVNGGSVMGKQDDGRALHKPANFFDSRSMEEIREIIRDYLIAATAKDCSLMLTFQQMPEAAAAENARLQGHHLLCSGKTGKFFRAKIRFVDLDLKPLNKMPHYYHIDQAIVKAYMATTQMGSCS